MLRVLLFCSAAALMGASLGCEKSLLPDDLPRTQYDRHDRLSGRYIPVNTGGGPLGSETPALRERLSPYRP